MKNLRIGLVVVLSLGASALNSQAHGGGLHFGFGLPCLSFGIGFGLGAACTYPVCDYGYGYPVYPYLQPSYGYAPVATPTPVVTSAVVDPPASPKPSIWEPRLPGSGKWVPDPEPYRYLAPGKAQTLATSGAKSTSTITFSRSPEGVLIYTVQAPSSAIR